MVREPKGYFEDFLGRKAFEEITRQANLYAVQVDPSKPLNASADEIEQLFGIALYMSVYGLPYSCMYWGTRTRIDRVASVMSLTHWETIKRFLHLADNTEQVTVDQPEYAKLFKVRPLMNWLLRSF